MSRAEACRYLFEIIRYSLAGGEVPTIHEGVDWEKLYRICKFHKIEAVVAHGIDKISGKEQIPQEVRKKYEQAWQMETARDTVQHFSLEESFCRLLRRMVFIVFP